MGKNWTSGFVHRYKDRLKSQYLRNINKKRYQAEYAPVFKQFYDLILYNCFFCNILLIYLQLRDGVKKYYITADNTYN